MTRTYTDLFTLLLPIGVLGIPLFGWITDHMGFTWSIVFTSVLGILFALCNLWNNIELQILTFIFYSFHRSFLFSNMFAYLAHEFGYRFFGILSGIVLGVGSALCLIQYPIVQYESANFYTTSQVQLYTFIATLVFPIYTYYQQVHRQQRITDIRQVKPYICIIVSVLK